MDNDTLIEVGWTLIWLIAVLAIGYALLQAHENYSAALASKRNGKRKFVTRWQLEAAASYTLVAVLFDLSGFTALIQPTGENALRPVIIGFLMAAGVVFTRQAVVDIGRRNQLLRMIPEDDGA